MNKQPTEANPEEKYFVLYYDEKINAWHIYRKVDEFGFCPHTGICTHSSYQTQFKLNEAKEIASKLSEDSTVYITGYVSHLNKGS